MKCVGERVIDMQGCDHKSICRFPSRTNSYGLIKGIIQEWGKEAGDAYQRAQEGKLITCAAFPKR